MIMCAYESLDRVRCVAIRRGFAAALMLVVVTGIARAEDWPQFRGPTGQGLSQATALPVEWDLANDVQWKVPVPDKGWSSPIVHDGRIFLTSAVPSEKDAPKQHSLRALCLDAANGETLWDVEVFVKRMRPGEKINGKNSFASPTPITDGQRVFVHFGPDGTACLDWDGKRIWANDRLPYDSVHGAGGSPVFSGSRLVLLCDGAEDPFLSSPWTRNMLGRRRNSPATRRSPTAWSSSRAIGCSITAPLTA